MQASICDALSVPGAARFLGSVRRPNLRYEVRAKPASAAAHLDDLAALIAASWPAAPGGAAPSGIVYCLSRRETEVVAEALSARGVTALAYHAHMETPARQAAHRAWAAGRTQVIVATVAFGMGINKVDVRFVIHHSISKSIETYYQEAGRAGRDGLPARCIAYFRPNDFGRQAALVFFEAAGLRRLVPLVRYVLDTGTCRHAQIAAHFGERAAARCGAVCDVCAPGGAAAPPPPLADLTPHAVALLATARELEATERSASVLQLVEHWRKSAAPERAALARALRPDDAELLVCHLLLLSVLRQDFSSTAYATNVYIKPGPAGAALSAGRLAVRLPLRVAPPGGAAAGKRARADAKAAQEASASDEGEGEGAGDGDDDDDFVAAPAARAARAS